MARERKNKDCITATIKICGEAMRAIHQKQSQELANGNRISIESAINKLLTETFKTK
jgi:hypothetical protein